MTGMAYCDRHFAAYASSGPCPDCEAMAMEARAKAAAAAPKAGSISVWPAPGVSLPTSVPGRFVVDKPLLAMVPRARTASGTWKVTGHENIGDRRDWRDRAEKAYARLMGMQRQAYSYGSVKRNDGEDVEDWCIRCGVDLSVFGGPTLDEVREFKNGKPREYSFPSKPAAPVASELRIRDDINAKLNEIARRDMERAYRDMVDIMDRIEAEALATPQAERSRKWAETLNHWAPKADAHSFFGIDRSNAPDKAVWHVHSRGDAETVKSWVDAGYLSPAGASRMLTEPQLFMGKVSFHEDPECPPGMAYLMEPLRPDDYVFKADIRYTAPSMLLKIKLPEEG